MSVRVQEWLLYHGRCEILLRLAVTKGYDLTNWMPIGREEEIRPFLTANVISWGEGSRYEEIFGGEKVARGWSCLLIFLTNISMKERMWKLVVKIRMKSEVKWPGFLSAIIYFFYTLNHSTFYVTNLFCTKFALLNKSRPSQLVLKFSFCDRLPVLKHRKIWHSIRHLTKL